MTAQVPGAGDRCIDDWRHRSSYTVSSTLSLVLDVARWPSRSLPGDTFWAPRACQKAYMSLIARVPLSSWILSLGILLFAIFCYVAILGLCSRVFAPLIPSFRSDNKIRQFVAGT